MSYNDRRNRPVESADANLIQEIYEFMPILAALMIQNGIPEAHAQGAAHAAALLVRKIDHLCMGQRNPFAYDIDCAVDRLHDHLEHTQRQTVPATEVRSWCQRLQRDCDEGVLRSIDDAFNAKHGRRAISF